MVTAVKKTISLRQPGFSKVAGGRRPARRGLPRGGAGNVKLSIALSTTIMV